MPNTRGTDIIVKKYDNKHGAETADKKPLEGATFTPVLSG